ncbi:Hypothetical protein I595_3028 [Croceitalea dokdonensis DOKDO 023]|uniref:Bacteriophage abortive infection AbiH n=1 Tax=Croceitalea dokdonensis DOKDO 023 TaxID=1300341 RepID=A0A0P7A3L0_9FLAO|nr:AbiH family protein [Croceitalea dokdonensis]KPM31049.1 Hypothetical protein I595_3028 [Croceitalea dokdonensis DOKDO 023]
MNKLIILGNGFDLAHGLPTSYSHFINHFWVNLINSYQDVLTNKLVYISPKHIGLINQGHKDFKTLKENFESQSKRFKYRYNKELVIIETQNERGDTITVFEFKNQFFKRLNVICTNNWVDIENEYYQELKRISKRKDSHYSGTKEDFEQNQIEKNKKSIERLNSEFAEIRDLFEDYLITNVSDKYYFNKFANREWIKMYEFLKPISLLNNQSKLLDEFNAKEDKTDIDALLEKEKKGERHLTRTYVLNFNYTLTTSQYLFEIDKQEYQSLQNNIHGILSNKMNNPVNFGFGDEMDGDYKSIENLNDNEYLKNFKSFKYSQNSNYKNLLDYIDSDKFQVYVMGHSCGLSDRTLLNTIFEHDNCRSIKVFYYQREDGTDNFTEIIQNMSRHFNDKKMMRAKVVNKSLCQPLPQNIRFQKKDN